MTQYFRKRIGQSGDELTLAIVFAFFLHVLVALATVFLYIKATPRVHVPLFYQVMLVGPPPDLTEAPPPEEAATTPPKKEPAPKQAKVTPEAKEVTPKKGAMPEFFKETPNPAIEQAKPAETPGEQPQAAATGPVTVNSPQMDEKNKWYLGYLRARIEPNWKPTPDAKDAKARVLFTINRSGWMTDVNLDDEHSQGTFEFKQAAIRAIRASNPFPPMPDEFPKQSLELSVDLVPKP